MGQIETTVNGLLSTSEFLLTKDGKDTGKIHVLKALLVNDSRSSRHPSKSNVLYPVPSDGMYDDPALVSTSASQTPYASHSSMPPPPTFTDYISGGCEINVCFAIDYTGE